MYKQRVIDLLITEGSWLRHSSPELCILERWAESVYNSFVKIKAHNHRASDLRMDKQKIIESMLGWLIAARDSSGNNDAELRLSAKTMYYEFFPFEQPSDDLSEIRSALNLPEDTSEPLVGVIWRLQQRVEELEYMIRGPFPYENPELMGK